MGDEESELQQPINTFTNVYVDTRVDKSIVYQAHLRSIHRLGYKHCYSKGFMTNDERPSGSRLANKFIREFDIINPVVLDDCDRTVIMTGEIKNAVIYAQISSTKVTITVWAANDISENIVDRISKWLKPWKLIPKSKEEVPIAFWMSGSHGATRYVRHIKCPSWSEIAGNYPYNNADIAKLLQIKEPWERGKLIFWHGKPGTGKTYAIRALTRSWQESMHINYIVDPERFFGDSDYMYSVIFEKSAMPVEEEEEQEGQNERGNLYIIEDTPDLLLENSQLNRCHEMARLLNLSDGLIGQGLRTIFLLTTNEKLDNIAPAFMRHGRLLQQTEFKLFSSLDAIAWLQTNGLSGVPKFRDDIMLADLYERLHGQSQSQSTPNH